jgi:uncharacterized membrane protein
MQYLESLIAPAALAIELTGVAVIVVGATISLALFAAGLRGGVHLAYVDLRKHLARSILLGLEFLVAADIIRTVTVDATMQSVAVLAVIVVIRTFLSISLEMEVSGHWPWQRNEPSPEDAHQHRRV